MSLSKIYADFVRKEEKERDCLRLYATDAGKCHRQIAYRLLETKKDYVSPQAEINKLIMFDIAEYLEETLWVALLEANLGFDYQQDVTMLDRENWGGRFDIIADYNGARVIEVKSLYPGAFKYDIDYPTHQHQARIYHYYLEEEYELEKPPILWYCDRGGQNTPVEQEVDVSEEAIEGTKREMDTIELVRKNLPELPDRLPRVLKERNYKKQIVEECSGLCNYCDYKGTCQPNESKSTWANRTDTHKPYEATKSADPERLAAFVDTIIKEIL